ncbi:hypothetical protein KSZ_11320 [Dictyobacter formicarum]|uniref:Uncharacterized protein n=1 Tax=Dictyobacter formicarum TaxID=2778368 RepID=A0ABQ3VCB8_9CHLR|nr:hypothetical protein KSZ_11320 [Dictyobacter formicarum]
MVLKLALTPQWETAAEPVLMWESDSALMWESVWAWVVGVM